MFRTSLYLAAAAVAVTTCSAFSVLPGALPAMRHGAFSANPASSLGLTSKRTQTQSALTLRAKEEFAEGAVAGGFSNKGEPPFQIRGFSLGTVALLAGLAITIYSFIVYFSNQNSLSSLGFVYGIPITLGGFALKYAEILPVTIKSNEKTDALWEEKATETLKKVREDVTRHRYGDDAHLDAALEKLGLVMPGKGFPQMQRIELSSEPGGELGFTMVFQSLDTPYKLWAEPARIKRYETFFGPNVNAEVLKISKEERLVGIKLTTGEARKGAGQISIESGSVSQGGATKLQEETSEDPTEEKRSMEV